MKCPICGKEITDETLICDGCGDTTACRVRNEKLTDLRERSVSLTLKPYRSKLAAVYAGLTSLVFVFGVMAFIVFLGDRVTLPVSLIAAATAVVAGISAYGCWRCFFAGSCPKPHFRTVGVLPAAGTYILMVVQILLFIMVFAGFGLLIAFAASDGGSAAADPTGTSIYGTVSEAVAKIIPITADDPALSFILLSVLCAVGCVIVGGLAGSFNKLRKQYAALNGYTRGKNDAPAGGFKVMYIFVWSAINAAVGVLLLCGGSFRSVCVGLLLMALGAYAVLSAVLLKQTEKQAVKVADLLAQEQSALDSLTERTERVAAYRAYRNEHPEPADDDDEQADDDNDQIDDDSEQADGDDEPANGSAVPVPAAPAPADDTSGDSAPADVSGAGAGTAGGDAPVWVLPPIED